MPSAAGAERENSGDGGMAVGREERETGRYHKIGMRGRGGEEEASSSLGVFFPRSEGGTGGDGGGKGRGDPT